MADMKLLLEEARDLLLERRQGSPARSAAHNARLVIEDAIKLAASPPAREEAPGEGEGDSHLNAIAGFAAELREALEDLTSIVRGECPSILNEDSGGNGDLSNRIDDLVAQHLSFFALRNRTSEPEAREEEAVAWRRRSQDNNPWTFFDSAEDRNFYTSGDRAARYSVQPLFTHPAPSDDRLRIAVEALERIASMGLAAPEKAARQALAALQDPAQ